MLLYRGQKLLVALHFLRKWWHIRPMYYDDSVFCLFLLFLEISWRREI